MSNILACTAYYVKYFLQIFLNNDIIEVRKEVAKMTEEERKQYLLAFGRRVRMFREALGMTQEELAVKVGYTVGKNPSGTISKIERGCMEITQSKIVDLARALQIEPYELFTDDTTRRLLRYAHELSKGGNDHGVD